MRTWAVIFDMDGVLLDSEPLHLAATNQVLATHGCYLPESDYAAFLGYTTEHAFAALQQQFNLPTTIEDFVAPYDQAVLAALATGPLEPAPGASRLIAELRERQVPLALASSSKPAWIAATLKALHLAEAFPVVVSGDDVQRSKPAPDIFLRAAEQLCVPSERCVVVEDSPHGVTAARAAGMRVLAVRTPYTHDTPFAEANRVVTSLEHVHPADLDHLLAQTR